MLNKTVFRKTGIFCVEKEERVGFLVIMIPFICTYYLGYLKGLFTNFIGFCQQYDEAFSLFYKLGIVICQNHKAKS
jgi:hypothetical protein